MIHIRRIRRIFHYRGRVALASIVALAMLGMVLTRPSEASTTINYDLIAMPDFLNQDVGDVSGSPYYQPGMPNSINDSYQEALDFVLNHVQSEGIRDISIAGDFVEGHWGVDTANTGVFGPVEFYSQKVAAYKLAAATYYPQFMERFNSRNFRMFPAVGDHEVWDNNWYRSKQIGYPFSVKSWSMMKNQYVKYMMKNSDGSMPWRFKNRPKAGVGMNTAYAYRPAPNVQIVSLDEFQKTNGKVIGNIGQAQLGWLEGVLKKANRDKIDWVIVQGHLPIIGPVRYRNSSNMYYQNRGSSALWKLMARYKVDLYLNGEVHDTTLRRKNGITQLSNGGLFRLGDANYATLKIRGNHMYITVKEFNGTPDGTTKLWQTDTQRQGPGAISYTEGPSIIGTAKLNKWNKLLSRTGVLNPYNP